MSESMWWQTGVIYQVYPRSFQDTDGDGVGDLQGIRLRLDYLVALGVDAVWISPVYPSPMADFGYDVADYVGIDPLFGDMVEFDELLKASHSKGLKVILDFVPNHTSNAHPWFVASRASRDNDKHDWYLWHDAVPYPWLAPGEDTRPVSEQYPNNWQSQFGGPAWTWDEARQQFYMHSFLKEQPDLNWRNPAVKAAMFEAMRFWLRRGVDGFRMDVLWLLVKDAAFRSNPDDGSVSYNADRPETHAIVAEMRAVMEEFGAGPSATAGLSTASAKSADSGRDDSSKVGSKKTLDRVLIGEIYLPVERLVRYYGEPPQLNEANLPFNFHLILSAWKAEAIADVIRQYEAALPAGAWPNYVLGNHDQSRLATRVGPLQARAAAMLLLTLRGTPTMYYGDELGMADVPIAPDQVRDPAAIRSKGRDPERSPMLWVASENAGFCAPGVTPWLPVLADFATQNAAAQSGESKSMLTLYRRLLALRRLHDTLHAGAIVDVAAEGDVLRYRRVGLEDGASGDFLVLLNLGSEVATVQCPAGTVVLTTLLDGVGSRVDGAVLVEGGEGLLVALDSWVS